MSNYLEGSLKLEEWQEKLMTKKIAIFTWLHNGNYGSVLQAFALQRFLIDHEFNAINFDYDASLKTKLINWWKNKNSPNLFLKKIVDAKGKRSYPRPELFEKREKKFFDFKKENMQLTNLYRTPKEVADAAKEYEIFICGSDQIWSPALMNPVYYLDLVPDTSVKVAYAPSFGVIKMPDAKKRQISGYLKTFKYLSVREKQGQALVKELINKDIPVQVDPTMLISREMWAKYAGKRLIEGRYIFCYLLTPNPAYIEAVKKLSRRRGIPVVIVPTSKGPFKTGFSEHVDVGPLDWVNYIHNAELVCTDSFHGCIFSAIFEKDFILFKRFSDADKNSENSRIYTLTELLGVEHRLIDINNMDSLDNLKPINFDYIRETIERESEKSRKWLLDILEKECG
nr:polysaccharide pyruvyl transferase family protein [uncultured Mediterraneibacter sp.]